MRRAARVASAIRRALAPLAVLALLAAGAAGPARAQITAFPEVPELLVSLDPPEAATEGGWLYGQIVLKAQLVSKHPFEALDFDLPLPEGVQKVEVMRPRTRRTGAYAGEGYVFETVVALFPTRSGVLEFPPARAAGVSSPEDSDREIAFDARGPAFRVSVAGAHPSMDGEWWMVSPRVEVEEIWSKPVEEIRVGDIVRRTVVATVHGATGHRVSVPDHRRTLAVRVADATTEVRTEITARGAIGKVARSWDLKFERGGVVYVAPVVVPYWNPVRRERETVAALGRRLEPLPADREAAGRGADGGGEGRARRPARGGGGGRRRCRDPAPGAGAVPGLAARADAGGPAPGAALRRRRRAGGLLPRRPGVVRRRRRSRFRGGAANRRARRDPPSGGWSARFSPPDAPAPGRRRPLRRAARSRGNWPGCRAGRVSGGAAIIFICVGSPSPAPSAASERRAPAGRGPFGEFVYYQCITKFF